MCSLFYNLRAEGTTKSRGHPKTRRHITTTTTYEKRANSHCQTYLPGANESEESIRMTKRDVTVPFSPSA